MKKILYALTLLWAVPYASVVAHVKVHGLRINNAGTDARVVLDLSQPHKFEVVRHPTKVVVHLPPQSIWIPDAKGDLSKKSLLHYYELKGRDLHFTVDPDTAIKKSFVLKDAHSGRFVLDLHKDKTQAQQQMVPMHASEEESHKEAVLPSQHNDQKLSVSPSQNAKVASEEKSLHKVEVYHMELGVDGQLTRMIMTADHHLKPTMDGHMVSLAPGPIALDPSVRLPMAAGGIYHIEQQIDQTLKLHLIPGAHLHRHIIVKEKNKPMKLIVDIHTPKPMTGPEIKGENRLGLEAKSVPALSESLDALHQEPHPKEGKDHKSHTAKQEEVQEPLIQSVHLEETNLGTEVRMKLREEQDFPVIKKGQKVIIQVPKMSWNHVHMEAHHKGVVENIAVDQTDPKATKLILLVQPNTVIVTEKITSDDKSAFYTLVLQKREDIKVHWGLGIGSSES